MTDSDEWLTYKEARALLGLKHHTLYRWIEKKFGPPAYYLYGQWKFKKAEVENWIEERRKFEASEMLTEVVSIPGASKIAGIHEKTLSRLVSRDKGPPKYLWRGRYVFKREEVEEWARENGSRTEEGNQQSR